MNDPFCHCGYRKSAHDAATGFTCPRRDGYTDVDGKVRYRPHVNPGVSFVESAGFNRGVES